eukprot:g4822.t1
MSDSDSDLDSPKGGRKKFSLKEVASGIIGLLQAAHPSPVPVPTVDADIHRLCALGSDIKLLQLLKAVDGKPQLQIDINGLDDTESTPLFWACRNGWEKCVKILLDNGADPEVECYGGLRSLHQCANFVRESILKILLERNADLEAADRAGNTVLHWACRRPSLAIVKILLAKSAKATAVNKNGTTPLHDACANGFPAYVNLLCQNGAQIDAKDVNGQTPLHLASGIGHVEVCRALLKAGAKDSVKNKFGKTPRENSRIKAVLEMWKELDAGGN